MRRCSGGAGCGAGCHEGMGGRGAAAASSAANNERTLGHNSGANHVCHAICMQGGELTELCKLRRHCLHAHLRCSKSKSSCSPKNSRSTSKISPMIRKIMAHSSVCAWLLCSSHATVSRDSFVASNRFSSTSTRRSTSRAVRSREALSAAQVAACSCTPGPKNAALPPLKKPECIKTRSTKTRPVRLRTSRRLSEMRPVSAICSCTSRACAKPSSALNSSCASTAD
mmetsp:Transcript_23164/g.68024  ORF Transcript_23164/g.68024 Transcript_23164/m.68024 type:complete len:226 (+) Transcript_23164:382-1059(+)